MNPVARPPPPSLEDGHVRLFAVARHRRHGAVASGSRGRRWRSRDHEPGRRSCPEGELGPDVHVLGGATTPRRYDLLRGPARTARRADAIPRRLAGHGAERRRRPSPTSPTRRRSTARGATGWGERWHDASPTPSDPVKITADSTPPAARRTCSARSSPRTTRADVHLHGSSSARVDHVQLDGVAPSARAATTTRDPSTPGEASTRSP